MSTKTEFEPQVETTTVVFTKQHIEDLILICRIAETMKPKTELISRYRERFEQLQ